MQYYVRELSNERAVLIAEDGHPLSTFENVEEAVATCIVDCRVAPLWIEWQENGAVQGIDNDCVQHALARHFKSSGPKHAQYVAA